MTKLVCIVCPKGCRLEVDEQNGCSVTGNSCPRGEVYGKSELQNPTRTITSTVRLTGAAHRRCPVKTAAPIPKHLISDAMRLLDDIEVSAPVKLGQTIVPDICGTGIAFVATRSFAAINY
ncbi:MAG: DUF1667 domain-containing protein [Defluviitaleaceae bacterium]|nr:DUF1667 domain-containing protein [Defluviitaleaceae bacterium]